MSISFTHHSQLLTPNFSASQLLNFFPPQTFCRFSYGICSNSASQEKTNFMKHLNLTIPKPCASSNIRAGFALLKASLACIILLLLSAESFSQTASVKGKIEMFERHESYMHTANSHIVRGIIKDEVGNPMPGVNIYLKGTAEGTVTDV